MGWSPLTDEGDTNPASSGVAWPVIPKLSVHTSHDYMRGAHTDGSPDGQRAPADVIHPNHGRHHTDELANVDHASQNHAVVAALAKGRE